MMRIIERWLMVLVVVVALSGCIKLDQTLSIAPDGSGTLEMVYGMSEQSLMQMQAMEQMTQSLKEQGMEIEESGSPMDFDFDEAEIRKKFEEEKPEGIELVDVSSEQKDGWQYMQIKLSFDDLESLKKTDVCKDSDMKIAKNEDGNYVLTQKLGDAGSSGMQMGPATGAAPGGEPAAQPGTGAEAGTAPAGDPAAAPDMGAQMMGGMTAMFAGMRISMTIVTPGEVIESNATETAGNRVSWVYDLDQDPQALSKLQQNSELRVVFSGEGVEL